MSVLPGKDITFRPRGLVDSIDGTNSPAGSMASLQNLIPSLTTPRQWMPRPAWQAIVGSGAGSPTKWGAFTWGNANWGGFDSIVGAAQINALLVVGEYIYGMIASTSGPLAGFDVPFVYNWLTNTFSTIAIPGGTGSLPVTPAATGDWTPPCMQQVASRIIVTHPGFPGGTGSYFGWIDVSGFSSTTITGNLNSTKTVSALSTNVLQVGWQVGMAFTDTTTGANIPANTVIESIASDGLSLTLSNAATATATGNTFSVVGGTQAAPIWGSGNTTPTPLTAVPVAVFEFNGRAYFAVGNGVQFSDALIPCQVTNATQAILYANGLPVTAFAGLPFTQTQGASLQALLAFQGDAQIQQITGDQATTNLSTNEIGIGVGTLAPNTICQTPLGVAFAAPDGIRYLDFLGRISEPIGSQGDGVVNPFLNAIFPSRMCAAYNQDVFRVTIQNAAISGEPYQEYWFHVSKKMWSGPHTSTCTLIQGRQGDATENDFIIVPLGTTALLAQSQVIPSTTSIYTEGSTPLSWSFQPTLISDTEQLSMNSMVETTMAMALPAGQSISILAVNETGSPLNSLALSGAPSASAQWGAFNWGGATWGSQQAALQQYDFAWTAPVVFKQMTMILSGFSQAGLTLGNIYMKFRPLGYRLPYAYAS